jgi:TrmH family RNA methyltransferase
MTISKAEFKDIKSLLSKKGRKERKRFVAEGVRVLEEAFRHGRFPEFVCFSPSLLSVRGEQLLRRLKSHGVRNESLKAPQLRSLADTDAPQGLLGVFLIPQGELDELCRPRFRKLLLCDGISDPGNLGTLFRSALAFGFDMLLLIGNCADSYSPKVVRSSMGAVFGLPITVAEADEAMSFIKSKGYAVIAADTGGKEHRKRLKDLVRKGRLVLAIGSEASGLSPGVRSASDLRYRISHTDGVESLNSAVAGSILMKQVYDASR